MNSEKNNEQMLREFLVYSYFDIVPKDVYEDISFEKLVDDDYKTYSTKRAIMVAYRDASNQGAYNTLFEKDLADRDKLIENSDNARKKSAEILLERIDALNEASDFKKWHNEVCEEIKEQYKDVKQNEKKFFTYGNAQKWVNMTMKYLWLLGLLDDAFDYKKLHIPIDSYIIDIMWKADDYNINLPCKSENVNREYKYAKPSDYVIGWSRWNDKMYKDFQDSLKGTFSLDWENDAWIKQAEIRKKGDRKKEYRTFGFIKE